MRKPLIKAISSCALIFSILLSGVPAVAYPIFTCAYEKDHNPRLDEEADQWFKRARYLEKELGRWPEVVALYEKAIAKDHWKAMHNLAQLYRVGEPGTEKNPGIKIDTVKMLELYERMVKLKVPLGYYNWAVITENGRGVLKSDRMASSYMFQAAQLGSPLAQVRIGQYFALNSQGTSRMMIWPNVTTDARGGRRMLMQYQKQLRFIRTPNKICHSHYFFTKERLRWATLLG